MDSSRAVPTSSSQTSPSNQGPTGRRPAVTGLVPKAFLEPSWRHTNTASSRIYAHSLQPPKAGGGISFCLSAQPPAMCSYRGNGAGPRPVSEGRIRRQCYGRVLGCMSHKRPPYNTRSVTTYARLGARAEEGWPGLSLCGRQDGTDLVVHVYSHGRRPCAATCLPDNNNYS